MALLLAFGLALLLAALVSERAARTVLSTAVVFLLAGLAFGSLVGPPRREVVQQVAELALVTVLVTDGARVSAEELRAGWRLPARALLVGFPLTVLAAALLGRGLLGLDWREALLVGAVLAPTDPVFAAALVGHERIPGRLRHLLNVESGVNDGLALPFVVGLLATFRPGGAGPLGVGAQLLGGVALGVAVPWLAVRLGRLRAFGVARDYRGLGVLASAIVVYAAASVLGLNPYLGAFAAGVTVGTHAPGAREHFSPLGERLGELLKLGAVLLLGALLSFGFVGRVGLAGWAFAAGNLFLVRPASIGIALAGADLPWRDRAVAGWFGPKGFASVVYGLLVAAAPLPHHQAVMHAVAATVVLSILLHSSTDVPVARWYERGRGPGRGAPAEVPAGA